MRWHGGKLNEAEQLYQEALTGSRATLGNQHPTTLASMVNLGGLVMDLGNLEVAEPLLREAFDGCTAALIDSHRTRLRATGWLADVKRAQGCPGLEGI